MLIPGKALYKELMTVPGFCRITSSDVNGESRPIIVVKASSHVLKILLRDATFFLVFDALTSTGPGIYGVDVADGAPRPLFIWSTIAESEEIRIIERFLATGLCDVHLFNELGVNVASAYGATFVVERGELNAGMLSTGTVPSEALLDAWFGTDPKDHANAVVVVPKEKLNWTEIKTTYYTDAGQEARLHAISGNEGDFQENLILWIAEHLLVFPVRGPRLSEQKNERELIDVLFSSDETPFLIESKALTTLSEATTRRQMIKRISKSVGKAIRQLRGACRMIHKSKIVDHQAREVRLPLKGVPHALVLIPDLELLDDEKREYLKQIALFYDTEQALLHILDTEELISLVKDACYLSARSVSLLPVDVFDAILTKRFKKVIEHLDPGIRFRARLRESDAPSA